MHQKKLLNKRIIISAAADGIGWAIAKECMSQGAIVYITDKNKIALEKISKHSLFEKQFYLQLLNTNNIKDVKNYFSKLKLKKLDALINNVGISGPTGRLENLNLNDWKETIEININSHFYFNKYSIPLLKNNKGGSIINLSSTAGLFGFPLRSAYSASKWAVIGMTKTLAIELGEFNIRVNALCPGSVSGDRINRVIKAKAEKLGVPVKKIQEEFESHTSLKTFIKKEDIANMATFLLSEDANKISGQAITVDGNTERMV